MALERTWHSTMSKEVLPLHRRGKEVIPLTPNTEPETRNQDVHDAALLDAATRVNASPYIRALVGTASHFCEVFALKLRTVFTGLTQAAGTGLASPCGDFVAGGFALLVAPAAMTIFCGFAVYFGTVNKLVRWEPADLSSDSVTDCSFERTIGRWVRTKRDEEYSVTEWTDKFYDRATHGSPRLLHFLSLTFITLLSLTHTLSHKHTLSLSLSHTPSLSHTLV